MPKPAATETKRYLLGPVAVKFTAAKTGTWRVVRPVFNAEKCTSCRMCEKFCPGELVDVNKEAKSVTFDMEYCKGCGICMQVCARQCIEMLPERNYV